MFNLEKLRYFDQSEMENYLNENSREGVTDDTASKKRINGVAAAAVVLGLLAGSFGMINIFSSNAQAKSDPHSAEIK